MAKKKKTKKEVKKAAKKAVKKGTKAAKSTSGKKSKAAASKPKVKKLQAIPAGYEKAVPYIIVHNGADALDFYKRAFGALELFRFNAPDGKIGHAEFKIGESNFMLADESPAMNAMSPTTLGGSPVGFYIYVVDVDSFFMKALNEGAKELQALEDKFYGDRIGTLVDPFGHKWSFGTHFRDVSTEEMNQKMDEMNVGSGNKENPSDQ